METVRPSWRAWIAGKPFAVWLLFGGLLYFALGLLILVIPFVQTAGIGDPIAASSLAFGAILLVAAFLSLKGTRVSFVVSAVVSILFLLLFGPFIVASLLNPAEPSFWLAISGIPALLLVVIFSILALRSAKVGIATKPYLASPKSTGGLLAIGVVGFVVGGLVVGNIAAASIARVLQGSQEAWDIRIVPGATGATVSYDPATYTVPPGGTVVWFNGDTSSHTITSNTTGLFDSGSVGPGAIFRVTFSQAGTYAYHCAPHPWMTGSIVVT